MTDVVASEIRTLHRRIAQLDRRLAVATLSGKVHPGSQDAAKRTLRLELGKDAEGQPILSPPVRWAEAGAGAFQVHAQPADGEQMLLHSPSGSIGGGSLAVRGAYDKDTAAPSQATDAAVLKLGEATITMKGDALTIGVGGKTLAISAGGYAFAEGGKVTHGPKNIGADHKHTNVEPGGGLSGPPAS